MAWALARGFDMRCSPTGFFGLLGCVLLLGTSVGCSSPSLRSDASTASSSSESSVVERLSDSLSASLVPPGELPPSATREKATLPARPLPPPKKEPWMDTLADLTGIPAPNAAVLIEEDPIPLNLQSVSILIAQRYRPARPVELTLRVYVTEAGTVRRYQVLRSSDPKLTPEYFVPPLLELRFTPAVHGGKPVSAWTTISMKISQKS